MQITIETEKLKQTLEKSLKDYDAKYEDLVKLYRKKMGEYIVALDEEVSKIVSGKKLKVTITPPYLQGNTRNIITRALSAVGAHADKTLEMSDNEYHNITSAVQNEINSVTTSHNSLGGTHYAASF